MKSELVEARNYMQLYRVFMNAYTDIRRKCEDNKIKFLLKPGKSKEKDGEANGYFDGESLVVFYGDKLCTVDNILTLLHESCHLDQMLENSQYWTDCFIEGNDVANLLELMENGIVDLSEDKKINYVKRIVNCEVDADRRTVKKILKYGFHRFTSVKEYVRIANAYQMEYWFYAHYERWLPADDRPYEDPQVLKYMPASPFLTANESLVFFNKMGNDGLRRILYLKVFGD